MPKTWINRVFKLTSLRPGEGAQVVWSFGYFFSLLCAYYIIRPMRDEMGIVGGVDNLQWLFTATLVVMAAAVPLYGWISSAFARRIFLPWVYAFFIINLLLFYVLMRDAQPSIVTARIFFVWTSVFNLFIVSVFWSFMADLYNNEQARRLFGLIAAGGTLGALSGPLLTATLVQPLGADNLLLVSAALLGFAILCIRQLTRPGDRSVQADRQAQSNLVEDSLGGNAWEGFTLVLKSPYLIAICLLMLLFTTLATFLYFMQAEIVRDAFDDSAQRTAVFAAMDFAVNALTLLFQLVLTARLISWIGLPLTLALVPLLLALGFFIIGLSPILAVLIVVQVIRRAGNYAIMRPAREMLYVVLSRREKYKAKSFIDTFVYRGGDAISAWLFTAVRALGMELSAIALASVPIALLWAGLSFKLGKQQSALSWKAS
jgi:AAA family ATP:ADP antiporter